MNKDAFDAYTSKLLQPVAKGHSCMRISHVKVFIPISILVSQLSFSGQTVAI